MKWCWILDFSIRRSKINCNWKVDVPSTSEIVDEGGLRNNLNTLQRDLPSWLTEVIFQFKDLIWREHKLVHSHYCRAIKRMHSILIEISQLKLHLPVPVTIAKLLHFDDKWPSSKMRPCCPWLMRCLVCSHKLICSVISPARSQNKQVGIIRATAKPSLPLC
jgi:hypothetical protein